MDYEKMSDFCKTLGNSTRLRIVRELVQGERCVGEVEDSVRVSQANVSRHLTILRKQGIVACRKQGNRRCYYLRNPEFIRDILAMGKDGE